MDTGPIADVELESSGQRANHNEGGELPCIRLERRCFFVDLVLCAAIQLPRDWTELVGRDAAMDPSLQPPILSMNMDPSGSTGADPPEEGYPQSGGDGSSSLPARNIV